MRYTAVFLIALLGCTIVSAYHSPADAVLQRLDDLSQAARNEQAEQTRIYVSQAQRCKVEQAFRTKEINDAEVAAGAADQQLQICSAELPIAQASLRQSRSELHATKQHLSALESEHAVFSQVNLARQAEHQQAISSIQGAYNIIGNFANGKNALSNSAFFVEVSAKINSVFQLAVKHSFHSDMIPVLSALVEVTRSSASTVSTSALVKVVKLLRALEKRVRVAEQNRAADWTAYSALYNRQKQLLGQQVTCLRNIIRRYKSYIQALKVCVRTEATLLRLANAKIARNSNILSATVQMCNAYDVKYKVQTSQRSEYVALLGQLRSFIVSAISSFKSGLYSRGDFVNEAQISKN